MRISVLIFCFVLLVSCNQKKKDYTPVVDTIAQNEVVINEIQQTSGYTYLLVQNGGKEFWMAVAKMDAKVGEKIYFVDAMEMQNFESKELGRVFESIVFVDKVSKKPIDASSAKEAFIAKKKEANKALLDSIKLDPVAGGQQIGELFEKSADYNTKKVKVRGQVVKVNADIMDRNWVHLVDGTEGLGKSDMTFTTQELVKVGDTVVLEGVLALDREFGAGYTYPVIVEEAVLIQ
ncbi:GW dipeptide domain-containing protein [Lutimonas sp.]|uniref:GW dipeptide domain-containing protein n=1 Tax=Lutimonas sp. TaxID=1872403 RepID=UPI003D9AC16E